MYVGICLEMLQFQSRHYVIALSADWLTQILKHAPTPHWCKITITRSLEGARYDAIPECPKCTRTAPCVHTSVNGEIWTPSIPCDNVSTQNIVFTISYLNLNTLLQI